MIEEAQVHELARHIEPDEPLGQEDAPEGEVEAAPREEPIVAAEGSQRVEVE